MTVGARTNDFTSSDIKYLQFGKDIKALADNLQQLERIFSHAFNSNQDRPWQRNRRELSPSLKPLLDITGDFNATLQECNTLLSDRKRFGRSSSNYVDNVLWWASTEKDVNALRERVHFHVTKIFFVIKPFEMYSSSGSNSKRHG